jgi:N-acetylmuramoyl-L-alanine amidase
MTHRALVPALAVLTTLLPWIPAMSDAGPEGRIPLNSELSVAVRGGKDIELEVTPARGDTYEKIAARFTGSRELAAALSTWNEHRPPERPEAVRIPLALLDGDYRSLVLRSLFPEDRPEDSGWVHVARSGSVPTYHEGLWQVAEWFTGRGENFRAILEHNRLSSPELRAGQAVRIPGPLLLPAFRPVQKSEDGLLVFGSDGKGPYAGYRLRRGEALYSAVVVRFTGRTSAEDVVALAEELAARSGIPDVRDIPVGYLVKIPLDYLEPEFLPEEHPRRKEIEAARAEMAAELAERPVRKASGLKNVLVILDPGHGGRDLGTMNNGIWEHDYVYDVACRLKAILERQSAADVFMTLEDKQTGFRPSSKDRLKRNLQGTIRTHPPFLAKEKGEAVIGVNLRWYLANSVYRKAVKEGTRSDRIVFLSLHADARHRSLSGAMVYLPGARYRTRTYGHTSATYKKYKEVKEKPTISFSRKSRVRSEAVSGKLARSILDGFRKEDLGVQKYKPIRDRIIRGRRIYVPAVLRGNAVPAKVLVEMVNLSNKGDAKVLSRAADRERLAVALARGLFGYFGEKPPSSLGSSSVPR